MIIDMSYWTRVLRRILYVALILASLYLGFKLSIILGSVIWGIIAIFSETSNLLQGLNGYVEKAYILFQNITNEFDFNKIHLPN